jgi:hypothetical protein
MDSIGGEAKNHQTVTRAEGPFASHAPELRGALQQAKRYGGGMEAVWRWSGGALGAVRGSGLKSLQRYFWCSFWFLAVSVGWVT